MTGPESSSHVLVYGEERFPYDVEVDPSRTGRIRINVHPDGSVNVDAPADATADAVQRAVKRRARWITKNVQEARERFEHVLPREYVSGETVFYLGRRYVLKVETSDEKRATAKLRGGLITVQTGNPDPEAVRAKLRAWYRFRAREYFRKRMAMMIDDLPWVDEVPPFQLKVMKKRWGSCAATGNVVLNPFLVRAPRECIDYVLIHELCHLKEHNHSRSFWTLMDKHAPGWRPVKKQLDAMAELILNE